MWVNILLLFVIEIKCELSTRWVLLKYCSLFSLLINRTPIYMGNMPSCTTLKKTTKPTHIHARTHVHTLTLIQIYSHTSLAHRPDSNASVATLKHIYLKCADRTKWESSFQVFTLIEVQLKLNLKSEYWQQVKYKMLSFPLFFPFFFSITFFFFFCPPKHKIFFKTSLPFQILHLPLLTCLFLTPSKCSISQQELQYNTGTGEKHYKRRAERTRCVQISARLRSNNISKNRIRTHIHYYQTRTRI